MRGLLVLDSFFLALDGIFINVKTKLDKRSIPCLSLSLTATYIFMYIYAIIISHLSSLSALVLEKLSLPHCSRAHGARAHAALDLSSPAVISYGSIYCVQQKDKTKANIYLVPLCLLWDFKTGTQNLHCHLCLWFITIPACMSLACHPAYNAYALSCCIPFPCCPFYSHALALTS